MTEEAPLAATKVYTHPPPVRPDNAITFLSSLLAAAACLLVYLSWWWFAAIFAFGSAHGYWRWHQANKAYDAALIKYQLANAQGWLRYFEKKGQTEPPWYHNDDESDWAATADDGVKNWKKTIKELEAKLNGYRK